MGRVEILIGKVGRVKFLLAEWVARRKTKKNEWLF